MGLAGGGGVAGAAGAARGRGGGGIMIGRRSRFGVVLGVGGGADRSSRKEIIYVFSFLVDLLRFMFFMGFLFLVFFWHACICMYVCMKKSCFALRYSPRDINQMSLSFQVSQSQIFSR